MLDPHMLSPSEVRREIAAIFGKGLMRLPHPGHSDTTDTPAKSDATSLDSSGTTRLNGPTSSQPRGPNAEAPMQHTH